MKLADYLSKNGITLKAFAERVGVTRQSLHRYMRGDQPKLDIAKRIEAETDGNVTRQDLMPEVFAATPEEAA